jgi:asparagine synthase (glutamine-hydrolysing)
LIDGRLRDRGIFDMREVARLWDEHRTRRHEHSHRLWQLVMLELWFRQFIDGQGLGHQPVSAPAAKTAADRVPAPTAWTPAARTITEAT